MQSIGYSAVLRAYTCRRLLLQYRASQHTIAHMQSTAHTGMHERLSLQHRVDILALQ
jgi:hypothetical protein